MSQHILRFCTLALCLVLVLSLTACAGESKGAADATRTVIDMTGNSIEIPATVDKVFVDWASGLALAMTLGATDKLIAVPPEYDDDTFAWVRAICPDVQNVPRDDAAFSNAEAALGYEPDLVITSTQENIDTYQNLGMTVIYVKFNNNESFKESLKIVGEALGEEEYAVAEKYCAYFDENVAMVSERLSGLSDADRPSVYYLDSRFADIYHTVGTGEIQEEWITLAGGTLATAPEFEGRNLEITAEKILEINPDIILVGAQNQAEVRELLVTDPVLSALDAVKNDQVYRIPQGMFPWCRTGPEAAIQMIWAGKLLQPEAFEDIDIAVVAQNFYKEFYGAELDDETLAGILAGKLCPTGE